MSLRSIQLPLGIVLCIIFGFWWGISRPVPMPQSPLSVGEKISCVSYAPFRRGQSPFMEGIAIPEKQIDEDFERLARLSDCVRVYAVDQGLENAPAMARKHGLKLIMGLWLGRSAKNNAAQIETGVRLANEHADVIRMVAVGNETLLRGEISEADLAAIIAQVKARVSVPITYADVWEFWVRHRALADLVDVITVHILPYWEDEPVPTKEAGKHIADIRRHVGEVFAGKQILIGETGWPSQGRMRWGARATPADQARALHDIIAEQKANGFDLNLIEAFDQPWKRRLEGTVGGYWGLLDADSREPKFKWGEAVSNHPGWIWQALCGALLAIGIFIVAAMTGKGEAIPKRKQAAIAVLALASGCSLGLAINTQITAARTAMEMVVASFSLWLAVLVPILCAAAIVRTIGPCSFFALTSGTTSVDRLSRWLTLALAASVALAVFVSLGLVFDPRYREFPMAVFAGPVAGFALASLFANRIGAVLSERIFAGVLIVSATTIVVQEKVQNWEALCFAGLLLILAGSLLLAGAARKQTAPVPAQAR